MKILFVCLGNICRSPTAEAVFKAKARQAGFACDVDSAGTGAWHAGETPDRRAQAVGEKRGYSFAGQKARKITHDDFSKFDYIAAMDASNLSDLHAICPDQHRQKLRLFLNFSNDHKNEDVPDPYYGGPDGFEHVVDLIEEASDGLIQALSAP